MEDSTSDDSPTTSRSRRMPEDRQRRSRRRSAPRRTTERKRAAVLTRQEDSLSPVFDARSLAMSLGEKTEAAPLFPWHSKDEQQSISKDRPTFRTYSLSSLFPQCPNFSKIFNNNSTFRKQMRMAIRRDIFQTNPDYQQLPDKAKMFLLQDPDASIQGNWKDYLHQHSSGMEDRLSQVLKEHLQGAVTGSEFMKVIGGLCEPTKQTITAGTQKSVEKERGGATGHFIDIVGIKGRKVTHSWHQDTGRSYSSSSDQQDVVQKTHDNMPADLYTVLLGFPAEDNYVGTGVFSHVVKLQDEVWAAQEHPWGIPVLYQGADDNGKNDPSIPEQYIVRPIYQEGMEILVFRDVDILHSAPDVCYRSSLMRFM